MTELGIIALTPTGWTKEESCPSMAIAALKAGAIGVLDLEFSGPSQQALKWLQALEASGGAFGIRFSIESLASFASHLDILSRHAGRPNIVILSSWHDGSISISDSGTKKLKQAASQIKEKGALAFMEVTSLSEAQMAAEAGFDAVIGKGNESSGRVAEETSYVLCQILEKARLPIPFWLAGGISLNTGAAAIAGGACGVVLDSQLWLMRESELSLAQKDRIAGFDGNQCEVFRHGGSQYRLYTHGQEEGKLEGKNGQELKCSVHGELSAARQGELPGLLPLSCDLAFASGLERKFGSIAAYIQALRKQTEENLLLAASQEIFTEESGLASANGTKYPILQGAMTRVSDCAEFAQVVAEGGALPFLALSLMRKSEIEDLLEKTAEKLHKMPWGVGMLGFVPPELRQEQLEVVLRHKPPFALIAGGRPDQAKELEALGVRTYLHVPSPSLLASFLEMGSKKFIFEGRECGGHVGPRSSFVLWESMIETFLENLPAKANPADYHLIFAGGIHDGLSAAMLAAMAAPLAERQVKLGILMGTAYLFCKEAVSSGAIVKKFQEAAIACKNTVLLETGPGHAIRCIDSPYKDAFDAKRKKLEEEGASKQELRQELEMLNLGRLRVASKGLSRVASKGSGSKLELVSDSQQWQTGMYMIGQVACLHESTMSIKELHENVAEGSRAILAALAPAFNVQVQDLESHGALGQTTERPTREPIAIVGMSCLFPKANDLDSYWQNIINKVDTIEEIPLEQWDYKPYYSADPIARDKIYSKWGGFLNDIPFDPSVYGIPPASLASVDPMQLLILEVTRAALADAGYGDSPAGAARKQPKERTSVVLANAGHGPITAFYSLRSMLDWTLHDLDPEYRKIIESRLPEWTEDSFPGYLGNVVAGRVANRFDLGGINFCVDAACASSLAALYIGVRELRAGSSDMVLLAATDTHNQPGDYLSFSKTHALSPMGRCRTFDASADGIVISEGMAVLVLKRLADAERDGDRIYALVRGIGGSSDGRDLSLTAPRPAGQMLALERAYEDADVSPASVELIEAHGTGTVAGDKAEVEALRRVFEKAGSAKRNCAIGSVKTMIGHSKCSAGLASVIKVAKSLYHKVLPPTINVETPNPACQFENSPFYINSEARPWLAESESKSAPRRAGVSAFGFGGTNFHTVLEEYKAPGIAAEKAALKQFPSELFVFQAATRAQLAKQLQNLAHSAEGAMGLARDASGPLGREEPSSLYDLALKQHLNFSRISQASKSRIARGKSSSKNYASSEADKESKTEFRLALVATSLEDLGKKLEQASTLLSSSPEKSESRDPRGVYFQEFKGEDEKERGKIAFLFPGQGSQQPNMLRELSLNFPCIRAKFEFSDSVLKDKFSSKLTSRIFPPPPFSEAERQAQIAELTDTRLAQPAVAAAGLACLALLNSLDIKAEYCAGHSFGEYIALHCAGVISEAELLQIAEQRGRILGEANSKNAGSMAAVSAGAEELRKLISRLQNVTLANINSPKQCIISGDSESIAQAKKVLEENQLRIKPIAVSAAFHSPLMEPAGKELSRQLQQLKFKDASLAVYSNTLAAPYPHDAHEIASLLCRHLVEPVRFQEEIEKMYADGARIFLECGPGAVLTGLVEDILKDKEHLCLSLERNGKNGISQLQHTLAQLFAAGQSMQLDALYEGRLSRLPEKAEAIIVEKKAEKPKLRFLINGAHIKRLLDGKKTSPANKPAEQAALEKSGKSQAAQISMGSRSNADASKNTASAENHNNGDSSISSAAMPVRKEPIAYSAGKAEAKERALPAENHNNHIQGNIKSRDKVLIEFQKNLLEMSNLYLKTQERVMLAYLQQNQVPDQAWQPDAAAKASEPVPVNKSQSQNRVTASNGNGNGKQESNSFSHSAPVLSEKVEENNGNGTAKPKPAELERKNPLIPEAEFLIASILQIVSERTGYPAEMLDPELDLEADLGIDSIKRVEILNSFRKLLPEDAQNELESGIEKLAGIKTLNGIFAWIREDLSAAKQNKPQEESQKQPPETHETARSREAAASGSKSEAKSIALARALVRTVELPALPESKLSLSGLYLISDSQSGLAEPMAKALKKAGADCLILRHKEAAKFSSLSKETNVIEIDLLSESAIKSLLSEIKNLLKKEGRSLAGLIHLLALSEQFQWQAEHISNGSEDSNELKGNGLQAIPASFFLLCRELLEKRDEGGLKVFAASALGGSFGLEAAAEPLGCLSDEHPYPLAASLAGIVKSLAREYPKHLFRAVDFDQKMSSTEKCRRILDEIGNEEKSLVEVGYARDKRLSPEAYPAALPDIAKLANTVSLDNSSVVLVTGGARGITAEICLELAHKHKPTFVIVARAPKPPAEAREYSGLSSPKELKAAIMNSIKAKGEKVTVPAVEIVYQRLLKEREIRENIAKLEAAGSRVQYFSLDIQDSQAFGELINKLYESFGRIDAVIHGAGVIEDAYLKDKSLSSFNRVFKTKIAPALTLASCLQFDTLKYLIFFSSIVGRTGNAGQSDYVAANEVMNKLAIYLNARTPSRVLSLAWGPWRGGMAQSELESLFARFGWSMIEANEGRKSFYAELASGSKKDAEVILLAPLPEQAKKEIETNSKEIARARAAESSPEQTSVPAAGKAARLGQPEIRQEPSGITSISVKLDPSFDLYLNDHMFDDTPVLPMAVACELMAEAAQLAYPKHKLFALEKMEIPQGIMFESGRAKELFLELSPPESENGKGIIRVPVSLATNKSSVRKNFKLEALLCKSEQKALHPEIREAEFKESSFGEFESQVPGVSEIYENWLFHGPLFQGIRSLDLLAKDGICGRLKSVPMKDCLKDSESARWLLDPLLLDSAMQLAGVWARRYMDITALPTGFKSLHILASPQGINEGEEFKAIVRIRHDEGKNQISCDLIISDSRGEAVLYMEGLGGVGSKAFNRLASQKKPAKQAAH